MTFTGYGDGEVICCPCFFIFRFWFINHEKNKYKTFKTIIVSVDSETIIEFFSEVPFSFSLKQSQLTDGERPFYLHKPIDDDTAVNECLINWPCVVYCFCSDCHKKAILIAADYNQISYEKALEKSFKILILNLLLYSDDVLIVSY